MAEQEYLIEDGLCYRDGNNELVVLVQVDGVPDGKVIIRNFCDGPKTDREVHTDSLMRRMRLMKWRLVTGGCVPGHVWGVCKGKIPCPECGKFLGSNRNLEWDHRGGAFYPCLECRRPGCDGYVPYSLMKDRGIWTDLNELCG